MTTVNKQIDDAFYKTLLESTKAIPWKIDWASMQFTYIGPQIKELLGWEVDSWVSAQDWAERIHPEDREQVVNFCIAQSKAGVDHEADYKALTKDNQYVWIRDVVHVLRKENGEVDALIGFMFDISERKKNEQTLVNLQKELLALSYKDSLTGIANRRMFDSVFDVEWQNAVHQRQSLALIFFDLDYFKQYNDFYGHLQGDECLKQVAQILNESAKRTGDFIARFGGEEFVLILPQTNLEDAMKVAERCRALIAAAQLPHAKSVVSPVVTISGGIGAITPAIQDHPHQFIESVDQALYLAKQQGRNCIKSKL